MNVVLVAHGEFQAFRPVPGLQYFITPVFRNSDANSRTAVSSSTTRIVSLPPGIGSRLLLSSPALAGFQVDFGAAGTLPICTTNQELIVRLLRLGLEPAASAVTVPSGTLHITNLHVDSEFVVVAEVDDVVAAATSDSGTS
jgi:hypothetical protein